MWVPFFVVSQEMRLINFLLRAQNRVVWMGAKKIMLKKLMCFLEESKGDTPKGAGAKRPENQEKLEPKKLPVQY